MPRNPARPIAALGAALALASPLAAAPLPMLPNISMSGTSGVVRIPTADVVPYGRYTLGVNKLDASHRYYQGDDTVLHFVSIGVVPCVEVTARVTNFEGNLGIQFRQNIKNINMGGWNFDRAAGIHVRLVSQAPGWPASVAIGDQEVTGNSAFGARYIVFTHRWPHVGVHFGAANKITLGRAFAGVDYQASRHVRVLLDHDGYRANLGCSVGFHNFVVTPCFTGLKKLGLGVAYNQPL